MTLSRHRLAGRWRLRLAAPSAIRRRLDIHLTTGGAVFARSGEEIEAYLGALDETDRFVSDHGLWASRRESWHAPVPGARQDVGNRDEPEGEPS